MSHAPVSTRWASTADVPALQALWEGLRQLGGRAERAVNPVPVADVAARLNAALLEPGCRIAIAEDDGRAVGMAVFRCVRPDPLSASQVMQVSHLVVAPGARRRGVGHALLAAAADFADELQLEHVVAGVYPSLRDASRFYARLGFAAVLVERVVPVPLLRRRLVAARRTDDALRRRTRLRRPVPQQRPSARVREPVN